MNPAATVLALSLAQPTQVFEEWELLPDAPLREAITARAVYLRPEGPEALLPRAVQGPERPEAWALGARQRLRVLRRPEGWCAVLPPGDRLEVRVFATVARLAPAPRLFRASWPSLPREGVPVRRVVTAPRDWVESASHAWTCPQEAPDRVPCVSTAYEPGPLVTRVPAAPSRRGALPFAASLLALSLVAAGWSPSRRAEHLLGASGGLAVALCAALALVGAHRTTWVTAVTVLLPLGALVGALAPRGRFARGVGTLALLVVPILAVSGVDARTVLAVAGASALLVTASS